MTDWEGYWLARVRDWRVMIVISWVVVLGNVVGGLVVAFTAAWSFSLAFGALALMGYLILLPLAREGLAIAQSCLASATSQLPATPET